MIADVEFNTTENVFQTEYENVNVVSQIRVWDEGDGNIVIDSIAKENNNGK